MRRVFGILICFILVSLMVVPVSAQEATAEPAGEATQEVAPSDTQAHYRIGNFAVDTPAVTVSVNGEALDMDALPFPELSEWQSVDAGTYQFSVSGEDGETALAQAEVSLEAGTWSTLALVGSVESGTLTLHEIEEDYSELNPGTGGLTVFVALDSDLMLNFNRDGVPYATELTSPGVIEGGVSQLTLHDDAGVFDFQFVETQDAANVLMEIPQDEIAENAYSFIALVGMEDNAQAVVNVTDRAEVNIELGTLQEPGTLLDAAAADENLTSFVNAVSAAGLTETLSGEGPFTVFVPANFVLDTVDMSDPEALAQIMRYHIVEGKLMSRGVTSAQTLETLAGEPIAVRIDGNNIFVNDAQIIALNIPATNGVIHMINGVLMPSSVQSE
jgi:uncharacterized surface protein with fasciclin (FAS1) repeats